MSDLLVVTALRREARVVARKVQGIAIHVIGIGAKHLPSEAARTIVLAGYGGALSPDVRVGDVVIDDRSGRAGGLSYRYGAIYCSETILATAQEKHEVFCKTGALAVDMESEPVRQWADRIGAEFVGVRAITDAADEPLDEKLLAIVDEYGQPRPGAILRNLSIVPAMVRLAGATRQADAALAEAVNNVVNILR
ncbi:MAG TPA: hypothetical protein VMD30_13550 [Tepidisphaeraceae bacterium]|nr:hypothetical protein [Tepidisphaeraceae bacterium]